MKINVKSTASGNPGISGWNAIWGDYQHSASVLTGNITADWLVIGGGFAGLAAARRLHQLHPTDKVVLVDAIRIGAGAAGRSSGFMIDLPHDINSDEYTGAMDADKFQTEMNRVALDFAEDAAREYKFTTELFDRRGKLYGAATDKGEKHNRNYLAHLHKLGEDAEWRDEKDMRSITGLTYYQSGLFTPGSAMIQPAGFVRELANGLASQIELFEDTPVLALERENRSWLAKTPLGSISAPKVILAVNGHLQSFGFMKRRLMHIFLYASMSEELSETDASSIGGQPVWDIVPSDPMGSTIRKINGRGGHRIIVRNKFDFIPSVIGTEKHVTRSANMHDSSYKARFPMLKHTQMQYRWGGRLCLTFNGVPVFGELETDLYAACAQNGLGASKGILSGILAAEQASGLSNSYINYYLTQAQPTQLPPEPLSTIGATVYLRWKEYMAGAEL